MLTRHTIRCPSTVAFGLLFVLLIAAGPCCVRQGTSPSDAQLHSQVASRIAYQLSESPFAHGTILLCSPIPDLVNSALSEELLEHGLRLYESDTACNVLHDMIRHAGHVEDAIFEPQLGVVSGGLTISLSRDGDSTNVVWMFVFANLGGFGEDITYRWTSEKWEVVYPVGGISH